MPLRWWVLGSNGGGLHPKKLRVKRDCRHDTKQLSMTRPVAPELNLVRAPIPRRGHSTRNGSAQTHACGSAYPRRKISCRKFCAVCMSMREVGKLSPPDFVGLLQGFVMEFGGCFSSSVKAVQYCQGAECPRESSQRCSQICGSIRNIVSMLGYQTRDFGHRERRAPRVEPKCKFHRIASRLRLK